MIIRLKTKCLKALTYNAGEKGLDVVLINDFMSLGVIVVQSVLEQVYQAVVSNQVMRGGTGKIFNANSSLIFSPESPGSLGRLWRWFIQIFTRTRTSGS